MPDKKRVCFAASSGGHLEELSKLSVLIKDGDFVLTERSGYVSVDWCRDVVYFAQINRRGVLFPFKFASLFIKSFVLFLRKRPDVVISTGALVTYPIGLLARLFGKKVIYIESFARVDHASLTGRLYYRIADVFIVQWEEMLAVYPDAVYVGGIF